MLWANGRTGNSDGLGLENVGLQADSRGLLSVDDSYRTAVPNIFAVGDVIGYPSLASAVTAMRRRRPRCILRATIVRSCWPRMFRRVIQSPEINGVGKTERELTAAKFLTKWDASSRVWRGRRLLAVAWGC
ncbi:MAG: FAD-dependent oxidoreductase [Pirellulales bacterium]